MYISCGIVHPCVILQAVECNEVECVELLLGARANVTCKDKAGYTCLHYAAHDGLHDVMEMLIAAGRQQQLDVTNNVSLQYTFHVVERCSTSAESCCQFNVFVMLFLTANFVLLSFYPLSAS